jgi:hypothetical protein
VEAARATAQDEDRQRGALPRLRQAALTLGGLLLGFGVSVMSDAEEIVPTGGELTLFEAVGRGGLTLSRPRAPHPHHQPRPRPTGTNRLTLRTSTDKAQQMRASHLGRQRRPLGTKQKRLGLLVVPDRASDGLAVLCTSSSTARTGSMSACVAPPARAQLGAPTACCALARRPGRA